MPAPGADRPAPPTAPEPELIAAWRADDDGFDAALARAFRAGTLDVAGMSRLEARLATDERPAFRRAVVARAVRRPEGAAIGTDAYDAAAGAAAVELFALPVLATRRTIDALADDERLDGLARAVRASGFSAEMSEVALLRPSLPPQLAALASPQALFDLAGAAAEVFAGAGVAAVPTALRGRIERLRERAEVEPDPDAPTLRLVPGVRRLAVESEGTDGLGLDAFFRDLQALAAGDDEALATIEAELPDEARLEDMAAHLHHMTRLFSDAAAALVDDEDEVEISLLPPVAWRHAATACAVLLAGAQLPLFEQETPPALHLAVADDHTELVLALVGADGAAGPARLPLLLVGDDVAGFAAACNPDGERRWHEDEAALAAACGLRPEA